MHNLAIALKNKGYMVSGSDDEIFDPARTRLEKHGLLPYAKGWFPEKLQTDIDAVILGMHAKKDNPELLKAQEMGLRIYSFPEYIYLNALNKTRVAIAGSHGKTSITSMIMHVLKKIGHKFDYMVGSSVNGFENSLQLTEDNNIIILEADEYLSSAINPEPKFLWYKPQIAVISGIAWDHANVFPTHEIYVEQFRKFIASMPPESLLIYHADDKMLCSLVDEFSHIRKIAYSYPQYSLENGVFSIIVKKDEKKELKINGKHNLLNMEAARFVCEGLGVEREVFLDSIASFEGAGKRLERLFENEQTLIFKDFAHAPSKVKATIEGVKDQFPEKKLIACLELHTYSSLSKNFLPQYSGSTKGADRMYIYINKEAVELKSMPLISEGEIRSFFNDPEIMVFYDIQLLQKVLMELDLKQSILLLMSSGNFGNMDTTALTEKLDQSS